MQLAAGLFKQEHGAGHHEFDIVGMGSNGHHPRSIIRSLLRKGHYASFFENARSHFRRRQIRSGWQACEARIIRSLLRKGHYASFTGLPSRADLSAAKMTSCVFKVSFKLVSGMSLPLSSA